MWLSGIEELEVAGADVTYEPELYRDRATLLNHLQEKEALIVRNRTRVDRDLLQQAPRLKVVGRLGVGLDNLDLEACQSHGVRIVYARNANAVSVAEYVLTAILTQNRNLTGASQHVKKGGWHRRQYTGHEIRGKTLGLVGVGEIAHRVAVRAAAFHMNVIGYDPFVTPYDFPVAETGIQLTSFDRLLRTADFVSIHVPLTPATQHLFTISQFKQMKPGSLLINTSRGGIIDERDLLTALEQRYLAGAVLDVLEQEPPDPEHPLLHHPNVWITPHIAGLTEESQERVSRLVAREVVNVLQNKRSLFTL